MHSTACGRYRSITSASRRVAPRSSPSAARSNTADRRAARARPHAERRVRLQHDEDDAQQPAEAVPRAMAWCSAPPQTNDVISTSSVAVGSKPAATIGSCGIDFMTRTQAPAAHSPSSSRADPAGAQKRRRQRAQSIARSEPKPVIGVHANAYLRRARGSDASGASRTPLRRRARPRATYLYARSRPWSCTGRTQRPRQRNEDRRAATKPRARAPDCAGSAATGLRAAAPRQVSAHPDNRSRVVVIRRAERPAHAIEVERGRPYTRSPATSRVTGRQGPGAALRDRERGCGAWRSRAA